MVDRYTKVVLTVIAGAMVWLCLFGLAPKWGTPAEAASGTQNVNIAAFGGKEIKTPPYGSLSYKGIPVEIQGDVSVRGRY